MAKCRDCKKEMLKVTSCDKPMLIICKDGEECETLKRDTAYFDVNSHCHDCDIENKVGNLHHFGCDMERCPKCGGQLISCGCFEGLDVSVGD
jgi:hypothetical protein